MRTSGDGHCKDGHQISSQKLNPTKPLHCLVFVFRYSVAGFSIVSKKIATGGDGSRIDSALLT